MIGPWLHDGLRNAQRLRIGRPSAQEKHSTPVLSAYHVIVSPASVNQNTQTSFCMNRVLTRSKEVFHPVPSLPHIRTLSIPESKPPRLRIRASLSVLHIPSARLEEPEGGKPVSWNTAPATTRGSGFRQSVKTRGETPSSHDSSRHLHVLVQGHKIRLPADKAWCGKLDTFIPWS